MYDDKSESVRICLRLSDCCRHASYQVVLENTTAADGAITKFLNGLVRRFMRKFFDDRLNVIPGGERKVRRNPTVMHVLSNFVYSILEVCELSIGTKLASSQT